MLKIGNKIFKVLALAGLFLSFPLLTWLPAAPGQARFQTGFNPAWSLNSRRPGPTTASLTQKLHLWLAGRVEPGAFEEAVKNSRSILNSPGFDLYLLGLWLKGRPVEALLLLDHQLNSLAEAPALLNQAGAFLFSLNEYNLAKEFLAAASSQAPGRVPILNNLGATSAALGLKQEAASYYRSCLELDPYQPEASFGLYQLSSLEPDGHPDQNWLIKALQGGYQDKIGRLIEPALCPLPLSFEQEININLPPLASDFEQYTGLVSVFQEALFELSQEEEALRKKLEANLNPTATVSAGPEKEDKQTISWPLFSPLSYARLLQIEGRLDWLERETERAASLDLERIITGAVLALETVYKTYLELEKKSLEAPLPARAEELKKARDYYCLEYKKQANNWYKKYRDRLLAYFELADRELKTSIPRFYFWLRYLPPDQQPTRRLQTGLRFIKIYSRLWEKSLQLLTRLGPPAFSDCLPSGQTATENQLKPAISLTPVVRQPELEFQADGLYFSIKDSQLSFWTAWPEIDLPGKAASRSATIYLYPPEGKSARPVYLTVDEEGRLNDIGELLNQATFRLSSGTSFEVIFNLSFETSRAPAVLNQEGQSHARP